MKRTLLCLIAGLAPLAAHAGCEAHFQAWMEALHPGRGFPTNQAVCKSWPANEARTIAVLPLPKKAGKDNAGTIDVEVLVADTATGAIVAHQFRPGAIRFGEEENQSFDGIDIDTARYQLAPDQRAFGVRLKQSEGPPADMSGIVTLSLFLVDGPRLRTVVDRLKVDEWNQDRGGACDADMTGTMRTLAMGSPGREGYAALQIAEKYVTRSWHIEDTERCMTHETPAKASHFSLEYRNGAYPIPAALQYGD